MSVAPCVAMVTTVQQQQ